MDASNNKKSPETLKRRSHKKLF
jgi:hypothetical protein